jgi:AcrR family transcriptional regulator
VRRRWRYVGRVLEDGAIATATSTWKRTSREAIAAATAELLDARDVSRVTVSVIARHARISPATFYRYFADRNSALAEAFTLLADRTFGNMTFDGPLGTREEEVRRFGAWLQTFHGALLRRAFRGEPEGAPHLCARPRFWSCVEILEEVRRQSGVFTYRVGMKRLWVANSAAAGGHRLEDAVDLGIPRRSHLVDG